MVRLKTEEEIKKLRQGGKILAAILKEVATRVATGVKTRELNDLVNELCERNKVIPVFLNYQPDGADRPYPASICISINDEIVHGIPNEGEERILKEGDVVSLDMGISHEGMIVDSAITVGVGKIDKSAEKLLAAGKEALAAGIKAAKAGSRTGDIGAAIEAVAKRHGFTLPEELGGHGVGFAVHEDPFIPNFGKPGEGVILKSGMVLAIEPMLNEGSKETVVDKDGYTFRTKDGKRSCHFEHTIVVTKNQPEILTI
ncbi:MAG TPA: type I methionyl aminopeptidase [Candidatus Paceibacterota bacterium]|nr:type I methionyl aminopeptidase [Candidatus Paceibacterota bacterium]